MSTKDILSAIRAAVPPGDMVFVAGAVLGLVLLLLVVVLTVDRKRAPLLCLFALLLCVFGSVTFVSVAVEVQRGLKVWSEDVRLSAGDSAGLKTAAQERLTLTVAAAQWFNSMGAAGAFLFAGLAFLFHAGQHLQAAEDGRRLADMQRRELARLEALTLESMIRQEAAEADAMLPVLMAERKIRQKLAEELADNVSWIFQPSEFRGFSSQSDEDIKKVLKVLKVLGDENLAKEDKTKPFQMKLQRIMGLKADLETAYSICRAKSVSPQGPRWLKFPGRGAQT